MSEITVFQARRIITMDRNRPDATYVAVRDGHILAVGGRDCADQWGPVRHDDQFANAVLMPGFVEGHAHMMAGAIWKYAYVGYHERRDPEGHLWRGRGTLAEVMEALQEHADRLADDSPVIAWGFDPIFLQEERLSKAHLDRISATRPIAILYSNFHLMCVNSAALAIVGYDTKTAAEGVVKGLDGSPTGELQEMAAMFPVMRRLGIDFRNLTQSQEAVTSYGKTATAVGVTTLTDLFAQMNDEDVEDLITYTDDPYCPIRLVPALAATGGTPEEIAQRAEALRAKSTDKLRLGAVKLMTDGSIQGWTARVKWPGYVGGQSNGIWNTAPDQIRDLCRVMHQHGIQMHIHVNGDEASSVVIDAIEEAERHHSWPTHRHVLQHGQLMGEDQFRRCAELGLAVNLFANHIWFFGDQHRSLTVGEDRASRMNACASALVNGLTLAIHSDAPVTPMGPLFTAWCAVNRETMTGHVLGQEQKISPRDALYAITTGAAQTLKMDGEIGSIEVGKRADFAVLGEDPLAVSPQALKDVPVLGTVLGGEVHLA